MTPAEITDLINTLEWPINDCPAQLAFLKRVPLILEQLRLAALDYLPIYLDVKSTSQPTLAHWQQAWLDQGRTLPITGSNIFGIWHDGAGHSASYFWYNDEMTPMMAYWWPGSSQFFDTTPSMYSNSTSISTTEGGLITQTLALAQSAYLFAEHAVVRNETTTTLQWRTDADSVNSTRNVILPNGAAGSPRIFHFAYTPTAKVNPSSIGYWFRTISGTGTALFTNGGVTRKLETGFYPYFLGEGYVLKTEAIYA